MCDALAVDMGHRRYLISKLSNTIIWATYNIFCRRNKPWNNPELLTIKDTFTQCIVVSFIVNVLVFTLVIVSSLLY